MADRPWDIVLYGATGFTGQLVAEQLVRCAGDLRWAIAGRDEYKLRDVKMGLVGADPACGSVGTIVADSSDPASLAELARSTRVLATTVGPYVRYGLPMVAACANAGTHYLDITGEPSFVEDSKRAHDDTARAKGTKIVHCCGFDSIPADLGAHWTVELLPPGPKRVSGYVKTRGRPSGGTWASLLEIVSEMSLSDLRGSGRGLHRAPEEVRGYGLPFPVIDPNIVARSAELLPDRYGSDFAYEHFLRVRTRMRGAQVAAGAFTLMAASKIPGAKRLLASRVPSGDGPDAEERARSFFELTFIGEGSGERVVTRVGGGDPGYTETSKMLATCATLLARTGGDPEVAGVVTPASALGDPLREALEGVGITFDILQDAA